MYENIEIEEPNFCIGPQAGTYCTVTTDGEAPLMHVVNNSGNPINTYTFHPEHTMAETPEYVDQLGTYHPPNVIEGIVKAIKYVGPINQISYYTGLVFYTLENWTETYPGQPEDKWLHEGVYHRGAVRRWKLNAELNRLELEAIFEFDEDKHHSGVCNAFAVETLETEFQFAAGRNSVTLEFTSTSGIAVGDYLMLGPSSDMDNVGAIEYVYVHSITNNSVDVRTVEGHIPPMYDYRYTDPVLVYRDVFIFQEPKFTNSSYGMTADAEWHATDFYTIPHTTIIITLYRQNYGILMRLDQRNYGAVLTEINSGIYKGITAADWYGPWKTLACVREGINLIMINANDPVNPFQVAKSQTLFNYYKSPTTYLDNEIIQVQDIAFYGDAIYKLQNATVKSGDDGGHLKVSWASYNYQFDTVLPYVSTIALVMIDASTGPNRHRDIRAVVRDQYGVALSGKNVWFDDSGDIEAILDSYYEVTDIEGTAYSGYTSGGSYTGDINLSSYADGSSIAITGSQYVWCYALGRSISSLEVDYSGLEQKTTDFSIDGEVIIQYASPYTTTKYIYHNCIHLFKTGKSLENWIGARTRANSETELFEQWATFNQLEIENMLIQDYYPRNSLYWELLPEEEQPITGDARYRYMKAEMIEQIVAEDEYDVEQLYISRHYDSDNHRDSTTLDQFQFIVESIPAFWSYKNPINTDIWIRLRPFAYSLNPSTLVYKIKEISTYAGDLGWKDITSEGAVTQFDAGGGLLGVEFFREITEFEDYFKYNSTVYVYVEVYDTSPIPNKVVIEFWFRTIPDYKAPYIENENPYREEYDVSVDTPIEFDLIDLGAGPDMDTLKMYVDQRRVWQTDYTYTTLSGLAIGSGYRVVIIPPHPFYYEKDVLVTIIVDDVSDNENILYDKWQFYCGSATGPWFDDKHFRPGLCKRGVYRYTQDISFQAYGIGDGVDPDSFEIHIGGKRQNQNMSIKPIVYRDK